MISPAKRACHGSQTATPGRINRRPTTENVLNHRSPLLVQFPRSARELASAITQVPTRRDNHFAAPENGILVALFCAHARAINNLSTGCAAAARGFVAARPR